MDSPRYSVCLLCGHGVSYPLFRRSNSGIADVLGTPRQRCVLGLRAAHVYVCGLEHDAAEGRRILRRAQELSQTNLMNSVGMLTVVIGLAIGRRLVGKRPHAWVRGLEGMDAMRVAGLLAAVGLAADFGMFLPRVFGVIGTQSSTLQQIGLFSKAALVILSYLSVQKGGNATFWFVLLFVIEFLSAGLVSSKIAILEVIIAVLVGRTLAMRKASTMIKGFLLLALLQFILQPVIGSYRTMRKLNEGDYVSSIVETSSLMTQSIADLINGCNTSQIQASQGWWSRLCYAPQEAFAMQEYDSGRPGNPWEDFVMGLIPRTLWPDKPLVSPGVRFSILINGNANNNNGPGVIGEGYWYGGWFGMFAVCLYVGVFLGGVDQISRRSDREPHLDVHAVGLCWN